MRSLLMQGVYEPTAVPASVIQSHSASVPSAFSERTSIYEEIERWYSGDALDEVVYDAGANPIDLYPLKINPFPAIVDKHVQAVLGTKMDVLTHKAAYREGFDEKNRIWLDNFINSLLLAAGSPSVIGDMVRISNIYGGVAVRAAIESGTNIPFWEFLHPKTFFCIPSPDHIRLNEAWIVRYISASEAKRLGYPAEEDDDVLIYTEHWTPTYYEMRIEEEFVYLASTSSDGRNKNPYGFVPFVYIPHERGGKFWGESVIQRAFGIVREINARYADFGDAVNNDAQELIAGRNVKSYKTKYIGSGGREIIDIGSATGLNASAQPDLFSVSKGVSHASDAMGKLVDDLWKLLGRVTYVPPVAFGEDEGSQRSSLTLETRFWPLTSHATTERRVWGTMLRELAAMTLKMCEIASVPEKYRPYAGWQKSDIHFVWSEMLPRDDETVISNLATRAQNNLGSLETLLAQLPDVDNPTEEARRVVEWMKTKAIVKKMAGGNTSGQASDGSTDVLPQTDKRSKSDA